MSDSEINEIIIDNNGKYKPIHILCGFGRSQKWKNVGGYLNLYYYLYGKTTPMPDFIEPTGYNVDEETIDVDTFLENDFDIELIPNESEKENIPMFDHYLTFPTDNELLENKYSYSYSYPEF